MKKNFFLTLMLAVFCIATSWAQGLADGVYTIAGDENLTRGYMCAGEGYPTYPVLTEITYSGCTGNSVTAVVNGKNWYVTTKAEGTYIYNLGLDKYLVNDNGNINFGDTPYAWTIKDNGNFKAIYDAALGKYLSMGCGRGPADRPIAWDTNANDGGAKHTFTSVENGATTFATQIAKVEADLAALIDTDPYVMLKAPTTGNYLSVTTIGNTAISFQTTGTKLLLENSSDGTGYYIRIKDVEPATYISKSGNNWDVSTSTTAYTWLFSEPDEDGYVTISHANGNLGHDGNQNAGTGIFADVGSGCNKWLIEEYNAGAVEYTFKITNPTGETVSATYNGNAITADETIEIEGMVDTSLFDATDVEGYTWSVVVNSGAKTITIVYVEKYNGSYYLKTSSGTYLNFTPHASLSTSATFQATGSELYIEPSGDNYYITQLNSNPVKYFTVSSSNAWDVTTSTTAFAWSISTPDANGYVTITKASDSSHRLGSDGDQNAGTGVFANVGTSCNTWQLVKVGPLDYTFAINNPTGETVSATYNGNAIAAGGTISIDGRVDTSLFSANEIEGYSWNVELDPDTRTITLVYEKKYNWSIVDLPDGATITYNSAAVTDGGIVGVDYDSQYLAVTCPNGYTWAVTRDDENKIVTITFKQLQSAENPQAVVDLLNRIGGAGTADRFKIVLDPSLNYTAEQFSINGEDGKILIKGTTISAITTGIGWYLQNIAHINIAWNSLNEKTVDGGAYADLSKIHVPTAEEIHTSDAMYRYYLNTCAFGYSMTSWTWKRWQQEIDWMALHGINMPLQLVGMEEVWRKFLTMEDGSGNRKYGYTDEEAKAFVAGPAFIAWWAMNNLQGWGGTAAGTKSGGTWDGAGGVQDDAWYVRQKNLAKLICDRQRELGMQPVIPGWSGMVPTDFASKSTYTTRGNGGNWAGDFVRPLLLSVSNANYAEIAADYYTCLHEVMGESQYYSMDPFHEGGGAGTMEDYEAMYAAMEAAMPGSKWVIQQWQWSSTQRYSLTAVPAGRLVVLDLFADGSPAFDSYNGYAPQDAVFSTIPNFGGRSGLMGRLTNLTDNYFKFKAEYSSIKGIGAAPEAIEQTPVTYDLIFQLPWMNGVKPDVAEWVSNYSIARYGVENEEIQEAWSLLRQGPLNYGADAIQGPVEDVWAARPNLDANHASYWGKTLANAQGTYTKARQQMLIDATYKLLDQSESLGFTAGDGSVYESNYYYDLVEFGGGVLADYAYYLLLGIKEAKTAAGENFATDATYIARRDAFLQLILDVDDFKGTNLNFRLGKWTQEARAAAGEVTGATTATADWYEYNNARTIVSTWSSPNTNLNDYSYRSWQGLMKDLYYPRWKHYFDNNCTSAEYGYFEWNWAHGLVHEVGQTAVSTTPLTSSQQGHTDKYTREPEGNTVDVAKEVLRKYIIPVKLADGSTYYAYRCLSSDINLTLNTTEGATLNLSEYITFGNTDGVTMSITSSLIDGTLTDLSAVTIKADACGDADSATDVVTVALSDGTSLTLTVVVNTSELATAKESLAALIEEMEGLAAQVGTYNPVGVLNEVTLTTTSGNNGYIWTNAQSSKEGPIAGLIDTDLSTYLHTDYTSTVTSGTHYIAVDLGEDYELGKFTIDYTTRSGAQSDFPDGIVVYGSDTNGDDYVKIAEITEPTFPQSGNKKWELGKNLYSNKRYLRFNVLAERGYWHMADFNIYKTASTAEVVNKYSSVIENEFAATQYDVLVDAKNTYDYGETTQETTDAVTALQAAIDALKEKMALVEVPTGGPFEYTIDESNPVLYRILVNRNFDDTSATVLQYDENENIVRTVAEAENASFQAWYFMKSTNGFVIKPYNAMGRVLSASSAVNAAGSVSAQEADDETYSFYEWTLIDIDNSEFYAIKVHGADNYFSNNGGINTRTMGFWNGDPYTTDGGSQFKFIEATFSNDNPRYYQLKDVTAAMDITKQAMSGDAPGCRDKGDEHYAAYTTAKGLIDAGSNVSASTDCYTAYTTLRATRKALGNMVMPTPGKVYRLRSYVSSVADENKNHYIANTNARVEFPTAIDENKTLWICAEGTAGKFKFISAMGSATLGWKEFAEEGFEFTLKSGVEQGAVALANGTDNLTLTTEGNANGVAFGHNPDSAVEQGADWSTDWYLEPVADAKVYYSRSIAKGYNWATMFLPFSVTVPDGIEAYTAVQGDVEVDAKRYVDLNTVASVIPARTAVVLYRENNESLQEFRFDFTTEEADVVENNIFKGCVMTKAVGGKPAEENYYLLFRGTNGEAFYWMQEEYDENLDSGATHIKCEGNKAYMVLPDVDAGNALSFSFRFPGTTGIDAVEGESGELKTIYDLQGRKLTEITAPGIYIVNGEKVLIK